MSDKKSIIRHYLSFVVSQVNAPAEVVNEYSYDMKCQGCENYEPFFKYRKCLYQVCPKGCVDNVFLGTPLHEDIISMKAYQAEKKMREYLQNPRKALGE